MLVTPTIRVLLYSIGTGGYRTNAPTTVEGLQVYVEKRTAAVILLFVPKHGFEVNMGNSIGYISLVMPCGCGGEGYRTQLDSSSVPFKRRKEGYMR